MLLLKMTKIMTKHKLWYLRRWRKRTSKDNRQYRKEMKQAAKDLDFEKATELRDMLFELKAEGWQVNERTIHSSKGARAHNLKDIDIELPKNKLIVMTGLSGSGKSSLAFDTIYAEGQRRYVESLSAYARQFLGQMDKPDVDTIEGLSPAISIDQKQQVKIQDQL